ncbi:MAG: aminodeoxychorismate synthase component I [Micavibrio sp.]|nr:aminodeoxychorismate synthase component I [Micavibrio sp.]
MTPFIRKLKIKDPLAVYAALEHLPYSLLLDSADRNHPNARYSFVVSHPIETIESKDGEITITNWEEQKKTEGNVFDLIAERLNYWIPETKTVRGLPPFQGGAAGFFGYDLARQLETLPDETETNEFPDLAVGIYDQAIAFDHMKDEAWIITHAKNYHDARKKQDYLIGLISRPPEVEPYAHGELDWQAPFADKPYQAQVRKVIRYIEQGDIFQANISNRHEAALPEGFDAFTHYTQLRKISPAPFSAFMNCGQDMKIASTSPERFLTVRDRAVEAKPIKGTRPRSDDPKQDEKMRCALEASEKERAENTMIVDLLRNDLSKTCMASSVHVSDLCKVESFAGVHHLVSTIRGTLKKDASPLALIRNAFPGGSITGAPKIRAMEIIEEIEPHRRGAYCGSMAYIGFDGSMDSSILIRTLVYEGDKVSLNVGGGITSDSDPAEEYQETLHKAAKIFESFKCKAPKTQAETEERIREKITIPDFLMTG